MKRSDLNDAAVELYNALFTLVGNLEATTAPDGNFQRSAMYRDAVVALGRANAIWRIEDIAGAMSACVHEIEEDVPDVVELKSANAKLRAFVESFAWCPVCKRDTPCRCARAPLPTRKDACQLLEEIDR